MSLATNTPLPLLLFAALATLAATGCAVSLDLDGDTTRRTVTDTVPLDGIRVLDVSTGNGSVDVRTADVDEIEVRSIFRESDEGDADSSIDLDGDRLVVRGDCDGGWFSQCSVGFRITVPDDLDVVIETDNGAIGVDGLAGRLDAETDNGAIEADGLAGATVHATTDNGRIQLAFDESPMVVDVATDNGAIAIRLPDDGAAYAVHAESDNGGIDVDVLDDPTAERRVTVESDNGSIDVEHRSPSS